jgi:hypothetical protein
MEKPAMGRYLLVLFSFFLALISKPMVVTLPLMMILLDYRPLDGPSAIAKSHDGCAGSYACSRE